MSNLFSTGLSGLAVARAALTTTAHNTANVYTEGYSRQAVQITSAGGIHTPGVGFIGSGAQASATVRSHDQYLASQLVQAQAGTAALTAYHEQIGRIDNLLADQDAGLAPLMQSFFSGLQGLANAAADPAARQQVVSAAQTLAGKFRSMDQYLTDLNASVESQVAGSLGQVNNYARQIASLNQQIGLLGAASGGAPNDLLDQRDRLVSDLSQLVGTKVVVQDGGQYNVFIGNGQTLVLGNTARELQMVASGADPSRQAVALVMAGGTRVELAGSTLTGGTLGGLLQFRAETLSTAHNALGRLALGLAASVNAQHQLGVDLKGMAGEPFFAMGAPEVIPHRVNQGTLELNADFADLGALSASDYAIEVGGTSGALTYTVTRLADGHAFPAASGFPLSVDGLVLSAAGGTAQPGDSFRLQPSRTGARDMAVQVTDPSRIAAAVPIVAEAVAGNQGRAGLGLGAVDAGYAAGTPAAPILLQVTGGRLTGFPAGSTVSVTLADGAPAPGMPYLPGDDIGWVAGATVRLDGMSFTMDGQPAEGDRFRIARNSGGVSDGRNALLLRGLQSHKALEGGTATFGESYAQLVTSVGNKARQLEIAAQAQSSVAGQIRSAHQSVSGVNQDEEAANLLMFQQMYQGNAKVIQTAASIFDAILSIRG